MNSGLSQLGLPAGCLPGERSKRPRERCQISAAAPGTKKHNATRPHRRGGAPCRSGRAPARPACAAAPSPAPTRPWLPLVWLGVGKITLLLGVPSASSRVGCAARRRRQVRLRESGAKRLACACAPLSFPAANSPCSALTCSDKRQCQDAKATERRWQAGGAWRRPLAPLPCCSSRPWRCVDARLALPRCHWRAAHQGRGRRRAGDDWEDRCAGLRPDC